MLWAIRRSVDAPWQEVYAALTDEAAIQARLTSAGACGVHVVEHDVDADRLRLRLKATIAVDSTRLPLCYRASAAELDWLADWTAVPGGVGHHATLRINIRGLPVLIRGTIRLESLDSDRTEVIVDMAATSSSSLVDTSTARCVGETIASLIERDLAGLHGAPVVVAA